MSPAGSPEDLPHQEGANAGCGVLLLHGFTGTPFELSPLTEALRQRGYRCATPLLAGHGLGVRALSRSNPSDWLASAEHALHDLYDQLLPITPTPRLAVIGLSMGGLLALRLAQRYPPLLRALCVLSAPLFLQPSQERLIRAFARGPTTHLAVPKLFGSDVSDRAARRANPATWAMPMRALGGLLGLMAETRALLADVHQPALLCHGALDRTAPPACLAMLAAGIGTAPADRHLLWLAQSAHLLPLDVERAVLCDAVSAHLARYLAPR